MLSDWLEVFPELADEPSPELWRQAWLGWCLQQGLPPAAAESCGLRRRGHHLEAAAPASLAERFRAQRGEVWLLAGPGALRTAALLEVHEPEASPAAGHS
jgi:hypothetical protein